MSMVARARFVPACLIGGAALVLLLTGCGRHPLSAAKTTADGTATTASGTTPAAAAPAAAEAGSAGNSATAPSGAAATAPQAAQSPAAHPDLVFMAGAAFDACEQPTRPGVPADGASATRAQMMQAQTAARAFDSATNVYLACVDQAERTFTQRYGRALTLGNLRDIQQLQIRLHNAAVDTDHEVADRFNQQLRIFKARSHS